MSRPRERKHNAPPEASSPGQHPKSTRRAPESDERPPRARATDVERERAGGESKNETMAQLHGVMPVLEAIRANRRPFERIMIAEGVGHGRLQELYDAARAARIPVRRVARHELERLTRGATHQGVVALIAAAQYRDADELLDELARRVESAEEAAEKSLAVVLDGVADPRNLGAILRTAECAGVQAVFVPERRAVGLTETVAKTAAGALEFVPVARVTNVARLVEELKERCIWTIGVEANAAQDYTAWDWTLPSALFFGGEGSGLHRLVRERCDATVSIPLKGRLTSLNVSVAAGVVLYEALRQRTLAERTLAQSRAYQEKSDIGENIL